METPQNLRLARRRGPGARRQAGYTLIELVITIGIVSILIVMGSTSFRYITNSNRVAAEVNGLLGDMQLSRMEAIKQGVWVTICTSTNGTSCAGTTTWQNGWIVFTDNNGNGTVDAAAPPFPADAVLRVQPTFGNTDTFVSSNAATRIVFNREGFATGIAGGTLVSLHDSSSNTNWTRCLQVNRSGMMVTQKNAQVVNGVTCS